MIRSASAILQQLSNGAVRAIIAAAVAAMDPALIRAVPLDIATKKLLGLYKFMEASRECPSGGRAAWFSACEQQNARRATPLPMPALTSGKVPGNCQDTSLCLPSEIDLAIRIGLSRNDQRALFQSKDARGPMATQTSSTPQSPSGTAPTLSSTTASNKGFVALRAASSAA